MENFTSNACTVAKESPEQKRSCEEYKNCLEKGYKETIALNILDALRETIQDSTGIITMIGVLGAYFLKWSK